MGIEEMGKSTAQRKKSRNRGSSSPELPTKKEKRELAETVCQLGAGMAGALPAEVFLLPVVDENLKKKLLEGRWPRARMEAGGGGRSGGTNWVRQTMTMRPRLSGGVRQRGAIRFPTLKAILDEALGGIKRGDSVLGGSAAEVEITEYRPDLGSLDTAPRIEKRWLSGSPLDVRRHLFREGVTKFG